MSLFSRLTRAFFFLCIFGIPLMVLTGWAIDNPYLTRIFPQFTPMNPVTATCFLTLGLYFLVSVRKHGPIQRATRLATSALLLLVGGAMLLKYGFGIDFYIDRIFFEPSLGINRMAPATSICFFLLGTVLLLGTRLRALLQIVAASVLGIGLYAMSAYAYNFVGLYGNTLYNPVAIHTAFLFVLVSSYLLFARSGGGLYLSGAFGPVSRWFKNLRLSTKFLLGFGTVFLLAALLAGYVWIELRSIQRVNQEQERIALAQQAALTLEVEVFGILNALDSYEETRDPRYLDLITRGRADALRAFDELSSLNSLPEVQVTLAKIMELRPERLALRDEIIKRIGEGDDPESYAAQTRRLEELDLQVRAYLQSMISAERIDLSNSLERHVNQVLVVQVNLLLLFGLMSVFMITLSILIVRSITESLEELTTFAHRLAEGNYGARTGIRSKNEIGMLAREFDRMSGIIKERTEALETERAKAEAILDSLSEGVAVADKDGKLEYWNPAAERIIGMQFDTDTSDTWTAKYGVFYPDEKTPMPGEKQALALAVAGQTVDNMGEFIRNAGNPNGRHISASARPVRLPDGTVQGAVVVIRDITKEYEVDKAKTEFVSLASHQLRTPLTSIKWYVELLNESEKLGEEEREYAKEIAEAMERMNTLVAALLDVSRLDLGTFIIEPVPADVLEVLETAVKEQGPTFVEKQQQFTFTHPDKVPETAIDKKLLFIVVQNLLSNAHKYSPEGASVKLDLTVTSSGDYLITCADTGYGIPKDQQAHMFSKLFRADNIKQLDVEGTGLGLYVLKTIIDAAGCSVSFVSEEGKGTTFTVTIPKEGMRRKEGTRSLSGNTI